MSESGSKAVGGGGEKPWTGGKMPCVYCGQGVGREVERCPHCKASYSLAVRRASREIEGSWFYLEPRNLSNRGVDFATILKLIEKGRLKGDSVVRGPTTHQDWMFAAEAPLVSKHLGVCPHCYGSARADQEFCEHCDRSLDERPGRLRPGAKQAKAAGYFPARDETEEKLAAALVTHDLAAAATEAAEREKAAAELEQPTGAEPPEVQAVRSTGLRADPWHPALPRPRVKVKLHVLAILTVATVVPLGLAMLWLPLDRVLPGDVGTQGTMAWNVHQNQVAAREAIFSMFGGKSKGQAAAEGAQMAALLSQGDAAAQAGELETARGLFEQVLAEYSATAASSAAEPKLAGVKAAIAQRERRQQQIKQRVQQISDAINGGRSAEARGLLAGLSAEDRAIAHGKLGADLALLEERIGALEVQQHDAQQRERLRGEVRALLEKARRATEGQRYKEALDIYEGIANKYPAEDLPADVKLDDLMAAMKARMTATAVSAAPADDSAVKARQLWIDVLRLEVDKKFTAALKKCDELKALPEKVRPAGLEKKIKDLKRGELFGDE